LAFESSESAGACEPFLLFLDFDWFSQVNVAAGYDPARKKHAVTVKIGLDSSALGQLVIFAWLKTDSLYLPTNFNAKLVWLANTFCPAPNVIKRF